jgi:hypothetical protein
VISVDIENALGRGHCDAGTGHPSVFGTGIGHWRPPAQNRFTVLCWGLGVTLLIGVIAAFAVGNVAASDTSTPKTWVSVVTTVAGVLVLGYAVWLLCYGRTGGDQMVRVAQRMNKVASAPAPAIIAAGAALANPGVFMLLAAKSISQLDPSTRQYLLDWALFALVALLPLAALGRTTRPNDRRSRPPRVGRIPPSRWHHRTHWLLTQTLGRSLPSPTAAFGRRADYHAASDPVSPRGPVPS